MQVITENISELEIYHNNNFITDLFKIADLFN